MQLSFILELQNLVILFYSKKEMVYIDERTPINALLVGGEFGTGVQASDLVTAFVL